MTDTIETAQVVEALQGLRANRRSFLGSGAAAAAGAALSAAAMRPKPAHAATTTTDLDILNFALNLEYVEAEYYLRGVYGTGLTAAETTGTGAQGKVVSVPATAKVTFTNSALQQYATEIANDEHDHVLFLRGALGDAKVAEPNIDIGNAFNSLAMAAGLGPSFDPYASQVNFLIGGFIFEDVGVTAYRGAAPFLSQAYIGAAASILAVEAYHASELRTLLATFGLADPGSGIFNVVSKISRLRNQLSTPGDHDQPLMKNGMLNIVPTDKNGLAYGRTTREVLNVVYGAINATEGLFFPSGFNGAITD